MISSPSSPTRSGTTHPTPRLPYLDGLRGLLCLVVVIHHYQCGFDPCRVFGPSAEWIADPAICQDAYYSHDDDSPIARQLWQILVAPYSNGPFAVATFFVMSGCALSLNLMSRQNDFDSDGQTTNTANSCNDDRWRLAVVKRFFRLALPCGAAMIFAYCLGWDADGSDSRALRFHERAAIATQSRWLYDFGTRRPPSIVGLIPHTLLGIWHGSSMLNNAIWTMKLELMGSYLVFLLVAVLKGVSSARRRRQILAVLGVALLLPSPSVSNSVEVHIEFESKLDATINGTATINPGTHFHLLESLKSSGMLNGIMYERQELEGWFLIDQPSEAVERKTLTANAEEMEEAEDEIKPLAIDSPDLLNLVGGSLASKLMHSDDIMVHSAKFVKRSKWSSSKPYGWYASFVAGVFLADRVHLIGSSPLLKATPMSAHKYIPLSLLTYLCASYPLKQGGLIANKNIIWSAMGSFAGFFGLDASLFYHTLGATLLVWLLTFQSRRGRAILSSGPLLCVGKISFALYLTHIPILYSLTSALYVWLKRGKQWGNSAGTLAFALSVPVLLLAAAIFEKYVDRPSIKKTSKIGRAILGVEPRLSSSFSGRERV